MPFLFVYSSHPKIFYIALYTVIFDNKNCIDFCVPVLYKSRESFSVMPNSDFKRQMCITQPML